MSTKQYQCAGCLILSEDTAQFLFQLRSEEVDQGECWGTWGGRLEAGETEARALRRELFEEARYTGTVRLVKLLRTETPELVYQNYLGIIPAEFTPVLNWESAGAAWVNYGDWPKPLHPGVQNLLAHGPSKWILLNEVEKLRKHHAE